jgi:hypothetical protein
MGLRFKPSMKSFFFFCRVSAELGSLSHGLLQRLDFGFECQVLLLLAL